MSFRDQPINNKEKRAKMKEEFYNAANRKRKNKNLWLVDLKDGVRLNLKFRICSFVVGYVAEILVGWWGFPPESLRVVKFLMKTILKSLIKILRHSRRT